MHACIYIYIYITAKTKGLFLPHVVYLSCTRPLHGKTHQLTGNLNTMHYIVSSVTLTSTKALSMKPEAKLFLFFILLFSWSLLHLKAFLATSDELRIFWKTYSKHIAWSQVSYLKLQTDYLEVTNSATLHDFFHRSSR